MDKYVIFQILFLCVNDEITFIYFDLNVLMYYFTISASFARLGRSHCGCGGRV